jgi:Zn finger protein HypA/HybF involved in hydrogenase expression
MSRLPLFVKGWGIPSSGPLTIDFDEPSVVASYKRKEKEEKQMQGYCVKCRAKKEMKNPKSITMKNGKPATQGTCPTCGTKMFRIGKA